MSGEKCKQSQRETKSNHSMGPAFRGSIGSKISPFAVVRPANSCPYQLATPCSFSGSCGLGAVVVQPYATKRMAPMTINRFLITHLPRLGADVLALPLQHRIDLLDEKPFGLLPRQSGVRRRIRHARDRLGVDPEQRIAGDAIEQIVLRSAALQPVGGSLRVHAHAFVQLRSCKPEEQC